MRALSRTLLIAAPLILGQPAWSQYDPTANNKAAQAVLSAKLALANQGAAQRFAVLYARYQRQLAEAATNNPHANPVMASPPTVTFSTTAPGSSFVPSVANTPADVAPYASVAGGWPVVNPSSHQIYCGVQTKTIGAATGGDSSTSNEGTCRYIINTDDPSPTFGFYETQATAFRVIVNGQYTNQAGYIPPAVNTLYYVNLAFGASAVRRIEIELQGAPSGAAFRGYIGAASNVLNVTSIDSVLGVTGALAVGQTVSPGNGNGAGSITSLGTGTGGVGTYNLSATQGSAIGSSGTPASMASGSGNGSQQLRYFYPSSPLYHFWAPATLGLRQIVLGDSITYGPVSNHIGYSLIADGFCRIAGDYEGIADNWCSGASSSGWITRATSGTVPNALDRLTDITAWAPDIISTYMGVNDASQDGTTSAGILISPTAYQAQVQQVLTAYRAAAPYAPICVSGTFRFPTSVAAKMTSYETALAAAVTALNDKLIVFAPTIAVGLQTGTGDDVTPNGTGNADLYNSGRDRTHPNLAGGQYLGRRAALMVSGCMDTIRARLGL